MNITDEKIKNLAWYVTHGFVLLPLNWIEDGHCSCGQNGTCKSPGKHPLTKNGLHDASADWDVVEGWHKQWPRCNWGARTGSIDQGGSNIVVVDIDKKSNGFSTWDMLRNEHPEPIETATVATGGGGQHLIFTYPEGHIIKSGTNVLGPGIDIRANGGYIVIPPSETEAPYHFEINPPFNALPDWTLKKLSQPKKEKNVIPQVEPVDDVSTASSALNALSKVRADNLSLEFKM